METRANLRTNMNTDLHFSSKTPEWETPQDLFDKLNEEFEFTLDVCATKENTKCEWFISKAEDALSVPWGTVGACWMNPPYGREIIKWMKKAHEESLKGSTVVCLVPARTDTKWWWEYAMKGEIRFIRGRLKFGGCKNSAPFPSAIVIFKP